MKIIWYRNVKKKIFWNRNEAIDGNEFGTKNFQIFKQKNKKEHLISINLLFAVNKTNKIIYVYNRKYAGKKNESLFNFQDNKKEYAINW